MHTSSLLTEPNDDDTIPFSLFPFEKKLDYIKELFINALPTVAAFLTPVLTIFISLHFLSKYNDDKLVAGFGIGAVFSASFGSSWIYSFNQATNVYISQAFGAQEYEKCGRFFRRTLIILGVLLIPLGVCLVNADKIMVLFGVRKDIAELGGIFTKYSMPFMIGASLFDSMKSFIIGQRVFQPILYIQATTLVLHVIWSKIFMDYFRLGIEGAVICRTLEEFANAVLIYLYIQKSGKFTRTWGEWTKDLLDLQEMWKQFKFTTQLSFITYVQWIFFEVLTIIAGNFDEKQVVVHVAIANTSSMPFSVTLGVAVTLLTFVGNNLGAQKLMKAKNYSHAGYTLLIALTLFIELFMFLILDYWLQFWTSDSETQAFLRHGVTYFLLGSLVVDGSNNGMICVLKSVGKEKQTILTLLGSLYLVGIPLIMLFAVVFEYKTAGIWCGFSIASVVMCIINITNVYRLDWSKIQKEVLQKLKSAEVTKEQELVPLV